MHTLFEKLQHVFSHFLKLRSERAAVKDEELNSEEREEFKEEVEVEHEVFISVRLPFLIHLNTHCLFLDSKTDCISFEAHKRSVL